MCLYSVYILYIIYIFSIYMNIYTYIYILSICIHNLYIYIIICVILHIYVYIADCKCSQIVFPFVQLRPKDTLPFAQLRSWRCCFRKSQCCWVSLQLWTSQDWRTAGILKIKYYIIYTMYYV